jgi:hypothetical protein
MFINLSKYIWDMVKRVKMEGVNAAKNLCQPHSNIGLFRYLLLHMGGE